MLSTPQGRRAVHSEIIELKIVAILSNGQEVVQFARMDTVTGEIRPLPRQRAELKPPMFQE